jgi:hypothetical protein
MVIPVELLVHPEHEKKTREYLDRVRQYAGSVTLAGVTAALWILGHLRALHIIQYA